MAKLRRANRSAWRSNHALLIGLVIAAAALGALNLAPGLLHADLHHTTARVALRQETGVHRCCARSRSCMLLLLLLLLI